MSKREHPKERIRAIKRTRTVSHGTQVVQWRGEILGEDPCGNRPFTNILQTLNNSRQITNVKVSKAVPPAAPPSLSANFLVLHSTWAAESSVLPEYHKTKPVAIAISYKSLSF